MSKMVLPSEPKEMATDENTFPQDNDREVLPMDEGGDKNIAPNAAVPKPPRTGKRTRKSKEESKMTESSPDLGITKLAAESELKTTEVDATATAPALDGPPQTPTKAVEGINPLAEAQMAESLPDLAPQAGITTLEAKPATNKSSSELQTIKVDETAIPSPQQMVAAGRTAHTSFYARAESLLEEENCAIALMEEPTEIDDLEEEAEVLLEEEEEDKEEKGKTARKRQSQSRKKQYTEDSIRLYLQEIGRIRLLRADEEIELARKIADLLELERIRDQIADQQNLASPEEVSEADWAAKVGMNLADFRRRLLQGRRAKDKMVQSNLRLVVSIAKKYMNRGLSFQDLIQEGSLGLIRAAEKFDHEKGYKFSTYATWWIRQAITRAIADQSRTIRLPVHLYETISRIKKTTKLLSQEMGRKPTEEEIADRMEMTIEKLRFIAKSAQLPISLETPIGKEEDSRLGDFIESEGETPDEQVAKALLKEQLEEVLSTLSPRERDVLRLRYGLDDGRMKTLEEIGQIFNVTRERIRQIEAKALRKLRHPNRNSILKEYIR